MPSTDTPAPVPIDIVRRQLRADALAQVAVLLESVANLNALTALTNAEINANPAAAIKALARETKTVARQTIRLARIALGAYDSADTGS